MTPSRGCIIVPSFNSGIRYETTILTLLELQFPLYTVVDGSTDQSDLFLNSLHSPLLTVIRKPTNSGKGAAVFIGMQKALESNFTHALIVDADGQHPTQEIQRFFDLSTKNPQALILGKPLFGQEAPWIRRFGHTIANFWVHLETGGIKIHDSLFGFRLYPIRDSCQILASIKGGKGYDFETQLAVRLLWQGYDAINIEVPVRYFKHEEGGISHFRYWKDNLLLIRCHLSLLFEKFSSSKNRGNTFFHHTPCVKTQIQTGHKLERRG